jgi:hypothetical protein
MSNSRRVRFETSHSQPEHDSTTKGRTIMKRNLRLRNPIAAFMMLSSIMLHPSSSPAAGSLTPPGAPAPTMKSLQEIEPRTLISSAPVTISAPSSYYLSNNITVTTGTAITIASSGVTLDLNGFTISSTAASPNGYGISISGLVMNITILNGFVQGGVTDNGSGAFSGSGFAYGISGGSASNVRVSGVAVSGCLYHGIYLNYSYPTVVEKCTVKTAGGSGITANVVESSSAYDCGVDGIDADQVSDSSGQAAYTGDGISTLTANNCYGASSSGYGLYALSGANNCYGTTSTGTYGIFTTTANNCYGYGGNTNSVGVYAYDATECYGYGGSEGVYAYGTANGCYGYSSYGYGVYAIVADNCKGYSSTSSSGSPYYAGVFANAAHNCYGYSLYHYGIQANAVNNCYGISTNSYGIYGYGTPCTTVENSYGYSYNSAGMVVSIANNCYGESQNGDGMDAAVANNCYGITHNGTYGLYASVANNCFGHNTTSSTSDTTGLYATVVANNCYGVTDSAGNYGCGLYADSANNCYGGSDSPNGYGLIAGEVAIGCLGYDSKPNSVGITAFIANSCYGNSENITYKYNMP